MIYGVGTDLVQIPRITKLLTHYHRRFIKKVLSELEIQEISKTKFDIKVAASFLAKRFAAKEAIAKALGTGIRNGLSFQNMSILNDHLGKPFLYQPDECNKIFKNLKVFLSISDDYPTVVAFAIITNK